MRILVRRSCAFAVLSLLAPALPVRAEEMRTTVPKGFVSVYGGFASAGSTNLKIVNNTSSVASQRYTLDVSDLKMKNSGSGGLGIGFWFFQVPFSLGGSFNMDFFGTSIKAQTAPTTQTLGTGAKSSFNLNTAERKMFNFVPALNLIAGIPLKFVRPYVGVGPAFYIVSHTIAFTDANGNVTSTATASDAKVGYNVMGGGEFFISRRFSAFVEGKFSQVNGLKFKPFPISSPGYSNEYDRLVSRRVNVGASFHF